MHDELKVDRFIVSPQEHGLAIRIAPFDDRAMSDVYKVADTGSPRERSGVVWRVHANCWFSNRKTPETGLTLSDSKTNDRHPL